MKKINFFLAIALFASTLLGCNSAPKATTNVVISNIIFQGQAAEFGTASVKSTVQFKLDSILKANKAEKVSNVKLNSLTLQVKDAENFDAISNITLQFMGKGEVKNATVANASNITAGTKSLELKISEEADVSEFFKTGSFDALIDLNLKDDQSDAKVILIGTMKSTVSLK
jgi:phosphate-selective porin